MRIKRWISYILILITLLPLNVRASSFNDILTSISSISCETLYLVKQSYFPHTCIPAAYSTTMIANFLSPGMYSWAMSRLKINDNQLLPGNCKKAQRADPYNPTISFSFCSNLLLVPLRLEALGNVVVGLVVDFWTGKDPWANIANSWYIDPKKYHVVTDDNLNVMGSADLPVGSSGLVVDLNLGILKDAMAVDASNITNAMINKTVPVAVFPWRVIKQNDTICVATFGITGWLPVGCKYMYDPYLVSKYHYFFHKAPPTLITPDFAPDDASNNVALSLSSSATSSGLVTCLSNSCYYNTMINNKALIPMSSPIVSCVQQMLTKALISKDICTFDQYSAVASNITARSASTLYAFQDSMRNAVIGFLTLYIMFVGFKILLGGEVPQRGELVRYVVKLVLVIYFSIGINVRGSGTSLDGMSEWILPIVFGGASEITSWIINASSNNFCAFSPSDYAPGYGYLALWDALDCRVANYLGIDQLGDFLSRNNQGAPNFDALRASIPPWVFLLFPAIYSGNINLVMLVLSYPLLVISTAAYMVYAFIVCLISITILSVLAPIFVPMVLFEYTKGYFDSWVKLIISFVLQPMVVATFMMVMFSVYDFGFFGTCKFKPLRITQSVEGTNVTKKMFVINNNMKDKSAYPNADAVKGCTNSLGWIFNAPFGLITGSISASSAQTIINDQVGSVNDLTNVLTPSDASPMDGSAAALVGTVVPPDQTYDNQAKSYPILSAIKTKKTILFPVTTLVGNLRNFMFSLFTACFCLYLLKHLSEQIAEFAADMTEGIVISPIKLPPPEDSDDDKEKASDTASRGGGGRASDTASRGGGGRAMDTASKGGGGRASDTASKGGVEKASDVNVAGGAAKASDTLVSGLNNEADRSKAIVPTDSKSMSVRDNIASKDLVSKEMSKEMVVASKDLVPTEPKATSTEMVAASDSLTVRDSKIPAPETKLSNRPAADLALKPEDLKLDIFERNMRNPNKNPKDIATEYRQLARQIHPDKNGGTIEAKERFQRLNDSYSEYKKGKGL